MPPTLTPLVTLPDPHGHNFYTTFYVLAFALHLGLLVWEGRRRGYPMRSWLVLLACTTLAFILGTKLLALSGPEWQLLLSRGHWPASEARTVLGGALAGTLTLLALRRPFGFSWHVFDAFTLPMCAALMVQCLGCLLTGCCFGHLTSGSWGVTYAPDTLPYLVQYARGLLPAGAPQSLPVHPTQLYSLGLCGVVALVLLLTRRCTWPGGSRRLLHLGLLLAGRFVIEFWRDPAGEQVGADFHTHAGVALKQVQWTLLVLAPLILLAWAWRMRRVAAAPETVSANDAARNLLAVAGLLALTAWLGPRALALPEVLVVKALLLAVLVLEAGAWLLTASRTRPGHVALPLGLACTILVLTSQSPAPTDSAAAPKRQEKFLTIAAAYSSGQFVREQNEGGGCGGASSLEPYRHRYYMGTFDIAQTQLPGLDRKGRMNKGEFTYGARLHMGLDTETALPSYYPPYPPTSRDVVHEPLLFAINPYVQEDRRWLGVSLGLLFGNLGYHRIYYGNNISVLDGQLGLRVGPRETLFAQGDYNFLGYGTANPLFRGGLGTGFRGRRVRVLGGVAFPKVYDVPRTTKRGMGFLEASLHPTPTSTWQMHSFITFANPTQQQFGLRVSKRFQNKK